MEEELVSFGVAKLAKEKGFIPNTLSTDYVLMYIRDGELSEQQEEDIERGDFYLAPTQALLQKWLREGHNIYVSINTTSYAEYHGDYDGMPDYLPCHKYRIIRNKDDFRYDVIEWSSQFEDYEEALEEGLYQALKLID